MKHVWASIGGLLFATVACGGFFVGPARGATTAISGPSTVNQGDHAHPLSQGHPHVQPHPLVHSHDLLIVAFGSSSTQGRGASGPAMTYPAQLQTILSQMLMPQGRAVHVINRGIGGQDADDMVKRIATDVIARHPDIVVWQTGSNDPLRHVPLDRFERETRDGISAMQQAGIAVLLMGPQWCPLLDHTASTEAYRNVIGRVASAMHVAVVRREDLMRDWVREGLLTRTQMVSADGLHMTDKSYALLARSMVPEIMKIDRAEADRQSTASHLSAEPKKPAS